MYSYKKAFTLVELIVVVTILGVLSTIGFVSYSSYLGSVRDVNRISNIQELVSGIKIHSIKNRIPLPDNYIEIKVNGEIVAYQGYAGKSVIETIEFSSELIDPKDQTYYSYYLTKDRKYYQLMGFLEEETDLQAAGIFNQTNAIDYSIRYPTVSGKQLGILTDEFNTPIQEIIEIKKTGKLELDTTDSGILYTAHIKDGKKYSFSGSILSNMLLTLTKPLLYGPPKGCPEGFIGVWGSAFFNQVGFCVAKYEMSYDNVTSPDSSLVYLNRNTLHYIPGKKIVSRAGNYPIADLNVMEAVGACNKLGKGYHLITNNERMSLARSIELEADNRSNGKVWDGYLKTGVGKFGDSGCDNTGGNIDDDRDFVTKSGPGINSVCNEQRSHKLFNSTVIWDLAGNVREHINGANTLNGDGANKVEGNMCSGISNWYTWSNCSFTGLGYKKDKAVPLKIIDEYLGVGALFSIETGLGTVMRGNRAGGGVGVSVYALFIGYDYKTAMVGFRCAYIK